MTLSASNLFINWTGCQFTPTGGSALPVDNVTKVSVNRTAITEKFKGGVDAFNRLIATPTQERTIEIVTGDVAAANAIPFNTPGTLVVKLADAVNGILTGGGGQTFTLTPCVLTGNPADGDHAKFASGTITFEGYFLTGATDPLTIALL